MVGDLSQDATRDKHLVFALCRLRPAPSSSQNSAVTAYDIEPTT